MTYAVLGYILKNAARSDIKRKAKAVEIMIRQRIYPSAVNIKLLFLHAAAGGMINYAAAYGNGGAAASYYYCSLRPVE